MPDPIILGLACPGLSWLGSTHRASARSSCSSCSSPPAAAGTCSRPSAAARSQAAIVVR